MKKTIILAVLTIACAMGFVSHAQTKLVGGDISLLPSYEQYNTPYYDMDGKKIDDVISYVKENCGWNAIRVRLFVNPTEKNASKPEGVVQDLEYVKQLGKRVKDAGLQLMLDFHYSDCWADPTNQKLPAAWSDCKTAEQKANRLYDYTKECLEALKEYGAQPDLVQVGNEISYGMVGIQVHPYANNGDDWAGFLLVLAQGCKAVRECCPDARIIIHTERVPKASDTEYFYKKLADLDYDIIGLSFYPIWHSTDAKQPFSSLKSTLDKLQASFPDKQVQVVETAYNYNYWPNSGVKCDTRSTWPCSAQGQKQYVQDLVEELNGHSQVNGLFWWFPEENGNGGPSWNASTIVIDSWLNRGLWDNSSHKALPALYELKGFGNNDQAIGVIIDERWHTADAVYNLHGVRMTGDWQSLPAGTYIIDGRKVQK